MAVVDEDEARWWEDDTVSLTALLVLPYGGCSERTSTPFAVGTSAGNAYMSDAKGCSVVYKYLHTTQVCKVPKLCKHLQV